MAPDSEARTSLRASDLDRREVAGIRFDESQRCRIDLGEKPGEARHEGLVRFIADLEHGPRRIPDPHGERRHENRIAPTLGRQPRKMAAENVAGLLARDQQQVGDVGLLSRMPTGEAFLISGSYAPRPPHIS